MSHYYSYAGQPTPIDLDLWVTENPRLRRLENLARERQTTDDPHELAKDALVTILDMMVEKYLEDQGSVIDILVEYWANCAENWRRAEADGGDLPVSFDEATVRLNRLPSLLANMVPHMPDAQRIIQESMPGYSVWMGPDGGVAAAKVERGDLLKMGQQLKARLPAAASEELSNPLLLEMLISSFYPGKLDDTGEVPYT
jgi:hypothetical protein